MGDQTLLSAFVASLNANLFLREFSFAGTCFTPPGGTEVELADHVVRVGDVLLLYQLKERDAAATGSVETWIKNKVVKKATRQIRTTISLLGSSDPVRIANERGHVFDLSAQPGDTRHAIVAFKSGVMGTPLPDPRFHRSGSVGFIHIFDGLDYLRICQYLITPVEIGEYLRWREHAFQSSDAASVSEAALLGQYMLDDPSTPAERFADALLALRNDVSGFDMSFILTNLADRIDSASKPDLGTEYYPLLQLLARMTRSELKLLKERLKYALTAVAEGRVALPARFVSPRLNCGVVVVPVATAHFSNRQVSLRNFSILAKYEQQTIMQIGIAIARQETDFIIDWYYLASPWSYDEEIAKALRDGYPFRRMSAGTVPRYDFDADQLKRSGLVGGKA
jgi:hypothetical protein